MDDNVYVEFDNFVNLIIIYGIDWNILIFYGDFFIKFKGYGLKIVYFNVRSLFGKISEIKFMLFESKFDIFVIIEIYLDDEIFIEYVMIFGY